MEDIFELLQILFISSAGMLVMNLLLAAVLPEHVNKKHMKVLKYNAVIVAFIIVVYIILKYQ